MRRLLPLALAFLALPALAVSGADRARVGSTIIPNGNVVPEFSAGSVTFREGNGNETRIGHTWDQQPNRQTRLNERYAVQVGGNEIEWTRRSLVPPGAIAKASALALKTLPVVATGVALWDMWNELRVRPDGAGGLVVDPGVPPVGSQFDQWCLDAQHCASTPSGVVQDHFGFIHPTTSTYQRTQLQVNSVSQAATSATVYYQYREALWTPYSCAGGPGWSCPVTVYSNIYVTKSTGTSSQCPASTDPLNPAYSIPAGSPVGVDGKCPTARYNHQPIAAPDAAARLEQYDPPSAAELPGLAEDALTRGQTIPDVVPETGTGPASVPGTPSTTTTQNPNGTTTTTTKTPTTSYTYNGDTITYTTTVVTVINNAGDVTTITENEVPEEEEACKTNPDAVGCMKRGELPTDAPTWNTVNVPFAAEDLGFAGACPAPVTWSVFGLSLQWGYQPVCDVAPMIRIALLLMASIGAIGIVFKETSA